MWCVAGITRPSVVALPLKRPQQHILDSVIAYIQEREHEQGHGLDCGSDQ